MTDKTTLSIGTLLDESHARDAVHFAVTPVIAAETLHPGDIIEFCGGTVLVRRVSGNFQHPDNMPVRGPGLGIVDPFLPGKVREGERFWMFLYPASITSLRHEWTHPAFSTNAPATEKSAPTEPSVERVNKHLEAVDAIQALAEEIGVSYTELMQHAHDYVEHGAYWTEGGRFESARDIDLDEFWGHYEVVTGVSVDGENRRATFFSCSC